MDLGLDGKTAIVTGGSAGIGLACAKMLFSEGVNVSIAARDQQRLDRAKLDIESALTGKATPIVIAISADLTKPEDVNRVIETSVERWERIDILINNAGSAGGGDFLDLKDEAYLDAWNLKLLGYIRMVRAVMPYMKEQGDGRIVNIIGGAAHTPSATFLPGSTANAAILNFTKGISKELSRFQIRINAISPGATATERARRLARERAETKGISEEQELAHSIESIPLGRMVDPDEIAAMAALMVSDRTASLTGAEIIIDGGSTPGI